MFVSSVKIQFHVIKFHEPEILCFGILHFSEVVFFQGVIVGYPVLTLLIGHEFKIDM